MLKSFLDNVDGVPADVASHYVKGEDGKYRLQVESDAATEIERLESQGIKLSATERLKISRGGGVAKRNGEPKSDTGRLPADGDQTPLRKLQTLRNQQQS